MPIARNVRFNSEEECLERCKRIINIKPGEVFYMNNKPDNEKVKCVFLGWDDVRMNGFYYKDDKEIGACSVSPACVTFENEELEFND